jgi:DNA primase
MHIHNTVQPVAIDPASRRLDDEAVQANQARATRAVLQHAARHYQGSLSTSSHALQYLRQRGVRRDTMQRYAIGFAPPFWRSLHRVVRDHDDDSIVSSGLLVCKDGENGIRFDRFRNRIMFPIRAVDGAVIGFGGRTLSDEECHYAKYMNSPESEIFHKGSAVYGLFEAREAIERKQAAIVVEGYLDVVQLAQHGFEHAVATMGTACTREQLVAVLAYTNNLTFCFDGDAAGVRAATAAMRAVLPFGSDHREIRFAFLPEGEDPDSLCRTQGGDGFAAVLAKSVGLGDMIVRQAETDCDLSIAEDRARAAHVAGACWSKLPSGQVADDVLRHFAALLNFGIRELRDLWNRAHRGHARSAEQEADVDVDQDAGECSPDLDGALKFLNDQVAEGVEYPDAHWQAIRRFRLSMSEGEELQTLYDQASA